MFAAVVLVGSIAAPANGADMTVAPPSTAEGVANANITETMAQVPFAQSQRLSDAILVETVRGYPVVGYRFANGQVEGEYYLGGGISAREYANEFHDAYGTEPQVVSAIVKVPVETARTWQREATRDVSSVITPLGPKYTAAPVDLARVEIALHAHRASAGVDVADDSIDSSVPELDAYATYNWRPTSAEIEVRRVGIKVYFSQYYYWDGTNARTTGLGTDDGFEMEVNIRTAATKYQAGSRGLLSCPAGYKDQPFAKNYGYSWSAFYNKGNGMTGVPRGVQAYADINDLWDPCPQSSMAIGFRNPQLIPLGPNGRQEVLVTITAPRGKDETGKISGVVQAVNEVGCNLQPWMALTDCMGTTTSTAGARSTLAASRGWTAPTKCWRSTQYGNVTPTTYVC